MQEVKRYKCDYCSRLRIRPYAILRHEPECFKNPECKNCFLCTHAVKGGSAFGDDGEDLFSDEDAFCTKHNQFLCVLRKKHITAANCSDYVRDSMFYNRN